MTSVDRPTRYATAPTTPRHRSDSTLSRPTISSPQFGTPTRQSETPITSADATGPRITRPTVGAPADWLSIVARTATFHGTGTLTAAAVFGTRATATFQATGVLTADYRTRQRFTVELGATGTLDATVRLSGAILAAADLTAAGVLSATTRLATRRTVDLTGTGVLSASTRPRVRADAALAAAGTLTATATTSEYRTAQFAGTGAFMAAAVRTRLRRTVDLTATGTLTATSRVRVSRAVEFAGTGALTATYTVQLRKLYREEFNSGDGDGWGPNFTMLSGTGRINSGAATVATLGSGTSNTQGVYNLQTLGDDMFVRARLVKPPPYGQATDNEVIFVLRGNGAWASGIYGAFAIWTGSCTFATGNGPTLTPRATGGAVPAGHVVRAEVRGNTWELWDETDNVRLLSWVDAENVLPGSPDRRRTIMYQETNKPFAQSQYASYATDWFEFGDSLPIPAPTITSFSPTQISSRGETLTVTGTGFYGKPTAKIDGVQLPDSAVTLVSPLQVLVAVGTLTPADHTLTLTTPQGSATVTFPVYLNTQSPAGMSRPASPSFSTAQNTDRDITGFAADPTYPGSTVVGGSRLRISGSGLYNVSASATHGALYGSASCEFSVRRNGSQVLQTVTASGTATQVNVSGVQLQDGDELTLVARGTGFSSVTITTATLRAVPA